MKVFFEFFFISCPPQWKRRERVRVLSTSCSVSLAGGRVINGGAERENTEKAAMMARLRRDSQKHWHLQVSRTDESADRITTQHSFKAVLSRVKRWRSSLAFFPIIWSRDT